MISFFSPYCVCACFFKQAGTAGAPPLGGKLLFVCLYLKRCSAFRANNELSFETIIQCFKIDLMLFRSYPSVEQSNYFR